MSKQPIALILAAVSTPEQAQDEKQSLDTQERELRAIAHLRNWRVEKVLLIPGYSRDYLSWEECAAEMAAQGNAAMMELKRLTEAHAYNILMVRDADRFGRTQALVMQVAETICIRHGLQIYSQMDNNLVEGLQARFWAAMVGLRVAGDQDKRKKYRLDGMKRRAQRGLPVSPQPPPTHIILRDYKGDAIKSVVDESKRPFFNDLYTVFVERRIAYQKIEQVLYEDYGHASAFGDVIQPGKLYGILTNPFTHGHGVMHFRSPGRYAAVGEWRLKEGYPVPEGVLIWYNTHEPVWKGEQFERLFAEFQRRMNIDGKDNPSDGHRFSGLLVCGECGYFLVYNSNQRTNAMRCMSHYNVSATRPDCSQNRWFTEPRIQAFFNDKLLELIQSRDWSKFLMLDTVGDTSNTQQLAKLEQEIRKLEAQMLRLIEDRSLQDNPTIVELYQKKLVNLGNRMDRLRQAHDDLKLAEVATAHIEQQREVALDEIIAVGLDQFWEQPDSRINQTLNRLLGQRRLVVIDGEVIATRDAPKRISRKKDKL